MNKKTKIFIVIGICLLVVGYLAYAGIRDFARAKSSITVSELLNNSETIADENLRIKGRVVDGSIKWDTKLRRLRFQIEDSQNSITVVYEDLAPDKFKSGMNIIADGVYTGNGFFRASKIMTTCPSKYKAKET